MKKILVPCDFSYSAKQAYAFALEMASKTNAELYVLKVIDFPFSYESAYASGHYYHEAELLKQLQNEANKDFESLRKATKPYERIHFSALQGPVVQTVLTYVENQEIDLVVMGTQGVSGMKEILVGSNTEKIVRFCKVPVIAIRNPIGMHSIKNIVVPTDLETVSEVYIEKLKQMQSMFDAKLHLLLVSTKYRLFHSNEWMAKLDEYARANGLTNYTLNLERNDDREGGIIAFAKEIGADMIAMATHGRKGLAHLFLGSLTEDVVNHVQCPVWTYSIKPDVGSKFPKKDVMMLEF